MPYILESTISDGLHNLIYSVVPMKKQIQIIKSKSAGTRPLKCKNNLISRVPLE